VNYQRVKEKNLEYFSSLLDNSDDEHYVVAQSRISHIKRFEKILELGDFGNKTVLDVGCGIGGFWGFLREKGIACDYMGVDINPHMIRIAGERYPGEKERFIVCDIIEEDLGKQFDYIISNGPLNLRFEGSMNNEMTVRLIRRMFHLAKIGIAITMTSSLTKKPNDETFYYNPVEILEEVLKFCPNTCMDHTYLPHDFTVFCYRNSLYDF